MNRRNPWWGVASPRIVFVSILGFLCLLAPSTWARPQSNGALYKPVFTDLSGDRPGGASRTLSAAAGQDTVYFGGTFWNAASSRWEALQDSIWTFDTGVGSHFDHSAPDVNPFKDPTLHAYMEGWVGVDLTYQDLPYFRRLASSDFPGGPRNCPIAGNYSFWAGVLDSEADLLCYTGGQGYGDNWNICIEQTFSYTGGASVVIEYDYTNDTELDFDFTYVFSDTTGNGDLVELMAYTDLLAGRDTLTLFPGSGLPDQPGPFTLKFCVVSDNAFSDQDGQYTTNCGAFALDNLSINGGGISYFTDFETGADGWFQSPLNPGPGGDWSRLVDVADLPAPLADCVCNFSDSVLVFEDLDVGGHNIYQNNIAASPWIDLKAAGVDGFAGKFIEMDIYADMPVLNYIYAQFFAQWFPYTCGQSGNMVSPWFIDGQTHYFGGVPTCTTPGTPGFRTDFSTIVDSQAEQVRIGIGIFSACQFFTNCTGLTNSTPWFDNVRFGVHGTGGGGSSTPVLSARGIDLPQDSFPEDGTLMITSPGRVDGGVVKGDLQPEPFTSLGDTLVVQGGSGGAEVLVQFAVRPGPGVDPGALNSFLSTVAFEESKDGLQWYSARMDTAEQGGVPLPGSWMTAFHEEDPGFAGSDDDIDPGDVDPLGGTNRLANDIFPDDLFTAGTRLNLFYKTRFVGTSEWFTLPDTALGTYEMEVLPSSFDSTEAFNCVLYVDHTEGGDAQELIDTSLATILTGGSNNWENTAWDRYNIRASSSQQAPFGRPSGTEYGATLNQALGYTTILWNSGSLDAFNLVNEDAQVLIPWLQLHTPGANSLYLSGDGIAASITQEAGTEPRALELLRHTGALFGCGTFSNLDCPTGAPQDLTACVNLDPVSGAAVSLRPNGGTPAGQGNGCPQNRSFDVLTVDPAPYFGAGVAEEEYSTAGKTAQYASVSNAPAGLVKYRTVVDGISVHQRREPAYCKVISRDTGSVEERLNEVLTFFGTTGTPSPCADQGSQIGVGDTLPVYRTRLANFSPNPLVGRSSGQIQFTLDRRIQAKVEIFDLNGRLVKTLFDGPGVLGENMVSWDGTDTRGRGVANGVYFYHLQAGDFSAAKKMVVLR